MLDPSLPLAQARLSLDTPSVSMLFTNLGMKPVATSDLMMQSERGALCDMHPCLCFHKKWPHYLLKLPHHVLHSAMFALLLCKDSSATPTAPHRCQA